MRTTHTLLLLALCTLLTAPLYAEESAKDMHADMDMEAIMGAYMEAATPGPEHAQLTALAGSYNCTTRIRMDPAGEWMESTATETIDPMLGGRFIHMHVIGAPDAMMPDGYEGAGILGYNNTEERFEQTWVDNMGSVMLFMTGTADDMGTITLAGSYTCPYFQTPLAQRWTIKPTKTGYVMDMYGPDMTGTEFLMTTVTAVRK